MGINDTLGKINKKLASGGTEQIKKILTKEAKLLQKMIRAEIANYKSSYTNKTDKFGRPYYIRTGNWEKSIKVSAPYTQDGKLAIKIYFDPNKALHPSYVKYGDQTQAGYVPWLLEVGWKWKKRTPLPLMFGQFVPKGGSKYIEKAIKKFNAVQRPYKLQLSVFLDDKKLPKYDRI